MPQQKSKRILLYIFLFLIIGSINNKNLDDLEFTKIKEISVSGLDDQNNYKMKDNLDFLKIENLFFLNKNKIIEKIDSNNLIEKYSVFKKYPSTVDVKIDKTNFLAQFKKGNEIFFLCSNGKIIKTIVYKQDIPFIFGNFKNENFFQLKKAIDNSNFDYQKIKNLFFFTSGRWDIEINDGLLIKLPKNNLEKKFNLLINFLDETKDEKINKIDLRQHNQIIING